MEKQLTKTNPPTRTMTNTLTEIERRLKHDKQMSDDEVEMVMAVIEEELTGDTDREAIDYRIVGDGRLSKNPHK